MKDMIDKEKIFRMFDKGLEPSHDAFTGIISKNAKYVCYREWLLLRISQEAMRSIISKRYRRRNYLDINYLKKVLKALKTGATQHP